MRSGGDPQKRIDSKTLVLEEYRRKVSAFRIVEARETEMVRKMPGHVICDKFACRPMSEADLIREGRLPPQMPIIHPDVFVCIYYRSHVCTSSECALCMIEDSEGVCRATGRFFYGKEVDDDRPFRYGTRPPKKVENHVQEGRTAAVARYKATHKKVRPEETSMHVKEDDGQREEGSSQAGVALAAFGPGLFDKTVINTILAPVPQQYDWSSPSPYAKEIRRDKSEDEDRSSYAHTHAAATPRATPAGGWTIEDEEVEDKWNRADGSGEKYYVPDAEDDLPEIKEHEAGDDVEGEGDGEEIDGEGDEDSHEKEKVPSEEDEEEDQEDSGGGGGGSDDGGGGGSGKKTVKKRGRGRGGGGGRGRRSVAGVLSERAAVGAGADDTSGGAPHTFQEDQMLKRRVVKTKRVTRRNGLSIGHNRKNLAMAEGWVYGETKRIVDRLLFDDDIRGEINMRNFTTYQADMEKIAARQRERCDARKIPYNPIIAMAIGKGTLKACILYKQGLADTLNPAARDNIHKTMARLWIQAVSSGWCHTSNHRLTIDKLCVGALYQMRKGLSDTTDVKIIPVNPFLLAHLPLATDLNLFGFDRTWICGMADCFRELHAWLRESQKSLVDVFHV